MIKKHYVRPSIFSEKGDSILPFAALATLSLAEAAAAGVASAVLSSLGVSAMSSSSSKGGKEHERQLKKLMPVYKCLI
jgi:hypothetical protein